MPDSPLRDARFHTTQWSLVLAAGGTDPAALNTLCSLYWYPVYAFIRRQGASAHEAEDLTQAYFARVIEKDYLAQVDRDRGKFRTFLLSSLKHFLANERDRALTQKRGGGAAHVAFDVAEAEQRYAAEGTSVATPEELFEKRAALSLLDAALAQLKREYDARGSARQFKVLAPLLTGDNEERYATAAAELDITPGALRVALHRMRGRFQKVLRRSVADMVSSADEVDDELRHLLGTLSQ
jgi:RNA polymerase sigma-70 factor (ECF subfamily)